MIVICVSPCFPGRWKQARLTGNRENRMGHHLCAGRCIFSMASGRSSSTYWMGVGSRAVRKTVRLPGRPVDRWHLLHELVKGWNARHWLCTSTSETRSTRSDRGSCVAALVRRGFPLRFLRILDSNLDGRVLQLCYEDGIS